MIERFEGKDGKQRLITALCTQSIIGGNRALAQKIAELANLQEIPTGQVLIKQGNSDTDIYFVISGNFSILVNGRDIATRSSGKNIGEMSLIDPSARRSATVIATELSVVAKITEAKFTRLANKYPILWRYLAVELSHRLRQRDRFHILPNKKPVVFIGSSSEMLPIARKIKKDLSHNEITIKLWTDDIFQPSSTTLDDLAKVIQNVDFAVLVLGQDDKVISRGTKSWAPRDNVVFELGMFIGVLGKARTLVVKPKSKLIKIPSDLLGFNSINYEFENENGLEIKTAPVCNTIRKVIRKYGAK